MTTAENFVRLPDVSVDEAKGVLLATWRLKGNLIPLDGERDLNFRVEGELDGVRGTWMFKICNVAEDRNVLASQERALDRLSRLEGLDFPSVVPSVAGKSIATLKCGDGAIHLCRLTRWVPGSLWSRVRGKNAELYRSLGACMARVDGALEDFRHDGLNRSLPWDIRNAPGIIDRHLALVEDHVRREWILRFRRLHDERLSPLGDKLRTGAIHNDANDNNVLVERSDVDGLRVSGLIDFGDMIRGWLVTDLAIACSYAVLDDADPIRTAMEIVAGYHRELPLLIEEIGVLFTLIGLRMSQSVLLAMHHQRLDPDNAYLGISMAPSWRLLEELARWREEDAGALFKQACGLG